MQGATAINADSIITIAERPGGREALAVSAECEWPMDLQS
jgi:hypothetical protein